MSTIYHYTPQTIDMHDAYSEIVLDAFRTFINDLALRAVGMARSPDDARIEIAMALQSSQYELHCAFEAFDNIFRQPSMGEPDPDAERLSRASTLVNCWTHPGRFEPDSPSAWTYPDVIPTVDPTHVTLNGFEGPLSDIDVYEAAARFMDLMTATETPENETGNTEPRLWPYRGATPGPPAHLGRNFTSAFHEHGSTRSSGQWQWYPCCYR